MGAVGSRVAEDSFPVTRSVAAGLHPSVVLVAGHFCDGTATPRPDGAIKSVGQGRFLERRGNPCFSSLIVTGMGAAKEEAPACQRPCYCVSCMCDCVSGFLFVCFVLWGIYLLLLSG